jgi:type IV secretory pathway protease TraF
VGVEAAFAFGAEKVGYAYGPLAQDELELVCAALRADFADAAESQYVKRLVFIVEVVDHHARVEFAEDQVVISGILLPARWMGNVLLGWRHRFR